MPVAANILLLGLDSDTLYFWVAAALEFCCTKAAIITACYRLYDQKLAFRIHCCSDDSQCQGKTWRFASQSGILGLPTKCFVRACQRGMCASWYCLGAPVHLYLVTALERSRWALATGSFEQHCPLLSLLLAALYNDLMTTMCWYLSLGYLFEGVPKIWDTKSLEDIRYKSYISLGAVEQCTWLVSIATYMISPQHSLGYEGWLPTSYLHPSLVPRPPRPAFVACSTKSGRRPGRIYHVMRAAADVTYCS